MRIRPATLSHEICGDRSSRRGTEQLFNSIDPSPFRNRDLDPKAEEFIVAWAKDLGREARLALIVDLDRPAGLADEAAVFRDAIHEFFRQRALAQRQRLKDLMRVGRTSLPVGLVVLASAVAAGDFISRLMAAASARSCGERWPLAAGSLCGALWRYFFMTGGRSSMRLICPIGWQACRYVSGI